MDSEKTVGTENRDPSTVSQNDGRLRGFSIYNTEGDAYYRGEVERMVYELRRELYPQPEAPQALPVAEQGKNEKKAKKPNLLRPFPLTLILILNLIVLAVIALSCFDVGRVGVLIAPFVKVSGGNECAIPFIDGLFAELSSFGMKPVLDYSTHTDGMSAIALIAFAATSVVFALLALVEVLIAIAGLAGRKKDGKGIRFGVVAFLMLIALVGVLLSLITLKAELGFGDLCSLIFPREIGGTAYGLPRTGEGYVIYSGYGLYILMIVPILNMIFSACVHKRKRK